MSKRASLDKREKETPKVIKGVMNAFVSSSSNDDVTKDDTNSKTESVQKKSRKSSKSSTENDAVNSTNNVADKDTKEITDNVADNNTKEITKNVTNSITDNNTNIDSENVSNNETKIVTNKTPKITHVKSIKIGNKTLESTYSSDELATRCAYHLRQDTIDKIEVCSKLSGMKKAEFVDLVLNSVLTEILNKGNKK